MDYCNSVLASSSKTITDELQRVLNAAARLISCTGRYDRGLSALLHDELHWLDIPQRVQYKLAVTVHLCLRNQVPHRLLRSSVRCCRHLRSASRHQLTVPRVRCSTFSCRSFASAGPTVCLTVCAIQLLDQSSFDRLRKHTCLPVVSISLTVR